MINSTKAKLYLIIFVDVLRMDTDLLWWLLYRMENSSEIRRKRHSVGLENQNRSIVVYCCSDYFVLSAIFDTGQAPVEHLRPFPSTYTQQNT